MQLIRHGAAGREKPGVLIDGVRYSTARYFKDYDETFFETEGLSRLKHVLAENKNLPKVPAKARWGAPVARPSKLVCVGLNYADHARESGADIPAEPVLFMKATTACCGPFDNVVIPRDSVKTDWEVELAFVIGKRASYVEEKDALRYLAGYCLHNDLSERAFQLERGGQWDKGKGCDTFAPLGPVLTTPEEIADIHHVRLWLKVNGKTVQDGNTSNLIFQIPFLIAYISRFMTLLPGDVVSTGTPPGVGLGMKPPVYLQPGDVMELGGDGLGVSKQKCVAWEILSI